MREATTEEKRREQQREVSEEEKEVQEAREKQEREARAQWEREEQEWRRAPGERDDEVVTSAQYVCVEEKGGDEHN